LANAFDATAQQISDLPAYIDPRLSPDPSTLPRKWWKEESNFLNGWSHRCDIKHPSPANKKLQGKTIAVKDNVSVCQMPLTAGTFPELLNGKSEYPISEVDATVVSRILQAGGTISGIATCEHFSASPLSFTSASGPVHNPWLKGYTTGGSSSGPAAVVAIKQVHAWRERHGLPSIEGELGPGADIAVGGDQGGSIRIPSAYTGLYGFKATHGLIPYTGILSLNPMIDHAGPMATNLKDLTDLLSVMAGYDGIDPRMTPESPRLSEVPDYTALIADWTKSKEDAGEWTPSAAGKDLRIGVIKEAFEVLGLTEDVKSLTQAAADRFKHLGAAVSEVSIPLHLIGPSIWTIATRIGLAEYGFQNSPLALLNHPIPGISPPPFDQRSYDILNKHNPSVLNAAFNATWLKEFRNEPGLPAKAMMHVWQLRAAYDEVLRDFDVLLTPANSRVGSAHPDIENGSVEDKMAPSIGGTLNTCQFNVTGHPALTVPVGFGDAPGGKGKLPVAMQLVGKRFDEMSVLKAAAAWEVGGSWLDSWDGK